MSRKNHVHDILKIIQKGSNSSVRKLCGEHLKFIFTPLKVVFFFKVNFKKMNYFMMFGSIIKNKLENIF